MKMWGVIVCLAAVAGVQVFADVLAFPENVRSLSGARIVSGWEAAEEQLPWQLSLRMVNATGSVSSCGGSIIHPEWGLTAAHCTATRVTMVIRAGAVSLWRPELIFETFEYFNHPLYIDALQSIVQPHDISILKFQRTITFSPRIQPIRVQLSEERNRNYDGVRLIASGWGRTWTDGATPENLQWVYLSGDSNDRCRSAYSGSTIIVDSTICASYYNVTSQSTCQGDSGGPLVELEEDGKYTLIGVTSFVALQGCHVDMPAGFIRPGHYHDWITQITGINFDKWVPVPPTTEKPDSSYESSESNESKSSEAQSSESRETSEESERSEETAEKKSEESSASNEPKSSESRSSESRETSEESEQSKETTEQKSEESGESNEPKSSESRSSESRETSVESEQSKETAEQKSEESGESNEPKSSESQSSESREISEESEQSKETAEQKSEESGESNEPKSSESRSSESREISEESEQSKETAEQKSEESGESNEPKSSESRSSESRETSVESEQSKETAEQKSEESGESNEPKSSESQSSESREISEESEQSKETAEQKSEESGESNEPKSSESKETAEAQSEETPEAQSEETSEEQQSRLFWSVFRSAFSGN